MLKFWLVVVTLRSPLWLGKPRSVHLGRGFLFCCRHQALMQRVLLPFKRPQCFKILFEHHEGELPIRGMTPAIAHEASDEPLTVMVDLR